MIYFMGKTRLQHWRNRHLLWTKEVYHFQAILLYLMMARPLVFSIAVL
jgi:hypothetical protein